MIAMLEKLLRRKKTCNNVAAYWVPPSQVSTEGLEGKRDRALCLLAPSHSKNGMFALWLDKPDLLQLQQTGVLDLPLSGGLVHFDYVMRLDLPRAPGRELVDGN